MADPGTITDLVERVDAYLQTEHFLFEVTGELARRERSDAATAVVLARLSAHHATHVELWRARRPEGYGMPVPPVLTPHGPQPVPSLTTDLVDTVLPALLQTYEAHLDAVDPAVDAPTHRVLRLVIADLRDDLASLRGTLNAPG